MLLVLFLIANCSLTVSLGMGLFSWLSDHRRLLMAPEEVDLADISENPYANTVILVCIDGFRPDYIESGHIPMLEYLGNINSSRDSLFMFSILALASLGYMGKMRSQFPSYTFPNHFSMVTGVHPEIHGIVNNRFHDRYLNATFSYKDLSRKDPKWWNYEPVRKYHVYTILIRPIRFGIPFKIVKITLGVQCLHGPVLKYPF